MLCKSVNSTSYLYTYMTWPYLDKPQDDGGEFYHPGTGNITKNLINWLDGKQLLDGQNSYPSFTLATCLLTKRHVTCVGTWIANRKILPKDIKKVDKSEILLTEFYWNSKNDLILGSYVDSSSRKKKNNVMIVATCRIFLGTTTDDGKNKAMLYKLYNFTKGQMDIVNQ